jgi:hypothetical protein
MNLDAALVGVAHMAESDGNIEPTLINVFFSQAIANMGAPIAVWGVQNSASARLVNPYVIEFTFDDDNLGANSLDIPAVNPIDFGPNVTKKRSLLYPIAP